MSRLLRDWSQGTKRAKEAAILSVVLLGAEGGWWEKKVPPTEDLGEKGCRRGGKASPWQPDLM